jgi:pilus assembly protein CpaF
LPIARRAIPPAPELPTPAPATGLHRRALAALIERASSTLDAASLDAVDPPPELVAKVDAALADLAAQLRAAGALPSELHADALIAEAKRELLESGPLGPLLDDEEVSEIQVIRHDFVLAMQGRRQVAAEVAFTSEPALARALRRLCAAAGKPLEAPETYVERRLRSGARLFAVVPPAASQGHMLVLRKPQRADLSLEDLVRSGTISRAMATLFGACMTAHANVLITGSTGSGTTSLLGALASAGSTDDRVVVLQEDDELILSQPHAFSILVEDGEDGVRALHAAARLQPDRVVVGAFGGRLAAEVVDAIGDGVHGVLAAARAPTLRQAILRLPADLAATRAGLTPEAAREWLASAFDVAIEIARLKDGRHRVMRVAELSVEGGAVQARDVFTFTVERTAAGGAIEGTFSATGVVPKLVDDLTARGIAVDPGIFRRNATR